MRNFILFCLTSLWFNTLMADTNILLQENFEAATIPPSGWSVVDHDGDGKNWFLRTHTTTGNKLASSRSYESGALTPHNLITTSAIDLSAYTVDDRLRVIYYIAATGSNYFLEHYKLVVSAGASFDDIQAGTIVYEETLTAAEKAWNLSLRNVSLSEFAGQTIYLSWVHFNCTNQDGLLLDNIYVFHGDDPVSATTYTSWLIGSSADVTPTGVQSGLVLAGGGGDNADAMKWMINRAAGGDVVVLRATGTDGYNNYLYTTLGIAVNSVETILVSSRAAAEDPYVAQQVRNAEALFIAGGDQYDYYQFWKDTPLMDAISYLINEKGVTVGGTSAGMAILGKVYYAPSGSSATSAVVLANPYSSSVNILGRDNFISAPYMDNVVTDTHFDARDRSGRLFTFLARMVTDWGIEAKGIAANEYTAVCVDTDGKAYVFGNPAYTDYAYFLRSQGCAPETCTAGQPLTWNCNQQAVKVYRVLGKKTNPDYFDLTTWDGGSAGQWQWWYAESGTLSKVDFETSASILEVEKVNVFPNPASGNAWFVAPVNGNAILRVYGVTGRLALEQQLQLTENEGHSVSISNLTDGVYIVKLYTKNGIFVNRIVVSR